MRKLLLILLIGLNVLFIHRLKAQTTENKLGIWLWYIDIVSEYDNHEELASHLRASLKTTFFDATI